MSGKSTAPRGCGAKPLSDRERDELQTLLDAVPAPLEPLDVSVLDGFLCGVLVQPQALPAARWLPHVTDADGRPLPPDVARGVDAERLHALVLRRHAELDDAIGRRAWFDPWVYESAREPAADDAPDAFDDVYPWVAGFATALELFPALTATDATALTEPLALLYRHFDADDLEDADDLLAEIASMEPPADLADAVEGLVRATLLLADISRPLAARPPAGPRHPRRSGGSRTAAASKSARPVRPPR